MSRKAEETQRKDLVAFLGLQRSYKPGADLKISFQRNAELKANSRDWVGLFKVGWSSSRDYYTFEWAPVEGREDGTAEVVFAGRRLPPDDGHFYQLCYVSRDGLVRGASPPFQMSSGSPALGLDDLEVVEVGAEEANGISSMVLLQPKARGRDKTQEEALDKLEQEKLDCIGQVEGLKVAVEEKSTLIDNQAQQIEQLKRSETALLEQLNKEKELLTTSALGKEEESQKLNDVIMQQRKETACLREEMEHAARENTALKSEVAELNRLLEQEKVKVEQEVAQKVGLCARAADLEGEISQQARLLEESNIQNTEREKEIGCLKEMLSETNTRVGEMEQEVLGLQSEHNEQHTLQLQEEVERLKQELSVAQQNVVELMCANQQVLETPPTAPPTAAGVVDVSAYEALQLAFENMERYYHTATSERDEGLAKLQEQEKLMEQLEDARDELLSRLEVCKKEFSAKAGQCVALQQKLQQKADMETSDLVQQLQAQELIMADNYTAGAEELARRAEELESLKAQLAAAQAALSHQQLQYDEKIAIKNSELDGVRGAVEALERENAQLQQNLEAQAATGKREAVRECPVCNTKFPARIKQKEFESHVSRHFK